MTQQHPMFSGARTPAPYGGSSAPGGSQGSREADADQIGSGRLTALYMTATARLRKAGSQGLTWAELGELESLHHGRATSVLSNMHREGIIVRLAQKRSGTRSSIYVLPEYTEGRKTAEYKGNKATAAIKAAGVNEAHIEELEKELALFKSKSTADSELIQQLRDSIEVAEINRRADSDAQEARIIGLETEIASRDETIRDLTEKIIGCQTEFHEVEQVLGRALGYPEAYPEVSDIDDGSVVVGEHTPVSLASEAVNKVESLRALLNTEREAARQARPAVQALTAEEAELLSKIKRTVTQKPDAAVQPARAGTLKALVALAERLPRA